MVKKQTVWLLTMLSLLIVLSVYYMTSPDNGEMAFIQDTELEQATSEGEMTGENADDTVISQMSTDELFAAIRLEMQNERDKLEEQLSAVMASTTATGEEKAEATEKLDSLQDRRSKESILEKTISASVPYEDVLVRAEENTVHVTVKANELSKSQTREIMQMVSDEFGDIPVDVKFQPTK
ncbi:SpoIIIAH-like family protein [Halobacillus shinanisalinarum]|uniref:SpoIIIAH-like family protein n=1 Tax=Halobacillus shinanisalinarum TaxID=2932258 RepID=A0ABY4GZS5_9BACI|nr:SpoIIIAH-like family protein [Halobacillus shinanisalinarum]UOQ93702.1 SpoIIIAH-like family protein [Halobacillus shinanisalinarum]